MGQTEFIKQTGISAHCITVYTCWWVKLYIFFYHFSQLRGRI